jgi:hypothetical protein
MRKLYQMGQGLALAGSLYAAAIGLTVASASRVFADDVRCLSGEDPDTGAYTGCLSTNCTSGAYKGTCGDYPPPPATPSLCTCGNLTPLQTD